MLRECQGVRRHLASDCELLVIDSTLRAPLVLSARNRAHVIFLNSVVEGDIHTNGAARVEFRNSRMQGRVVRLGNSRVTGLPWFDEQERLRPSR